MPRRKKTAIGANKKPDNKMEMARAVLRVDASLTPKQLVAAIKEQFATDIDLKMAKNYKFKILRKMREAASPAKSVAPVTATIVVSPRPIVRDTTKDALDNLLMSAQQLGWKRVKEIVDGVIQAPG